MRAARGPRKGKPQPEGCVPWGDPEPRWDAGRSLGSRGRFAGQEEDFGSCGGRVLGSSRAADGETVTAWLPPGPGRMDEHDFHPRTSHPDHNEMTHRRGRGCATEEEPSLSLLCGWACETERIYCELGGEAAASQIEGPGTCLVAKLRGAEGSGSLPWTSRVPLPQASCLLTPGPSDLTRDGTRKQRGPEEQKWVLGGTPLRRFDFVPARGLALLQVASLLGNDPEGQGRVAAFSSAAAPAPRLFLPEWPQQSDGHRGGIPERGVSVPGVTLESLREEDAGRYWCGIDTSWFEGMLRDPTFEVEVSVIPAPATATSTERSTGSPGSPTTLPVPTWSTVSGQETPDPSQPPRPLLGSAHFLLLVFLKVPLLLGMLGAVLWVHRPLRSSADRQSQSIYENQ
nr:uncharacterized protein LOC101104414 isoform X2 [Ovis aries]